MKLAALLLFAAGIAAAQPRVIVSPGAPEVGNCLELVDVGRMHVRSEDIANGPIGVFRCTQVYSNSLGTAAYAWQPIGHFVGPNLPPHCAVGDMAVRIPSTPSLFVCTATDTWTATGGGGSGGNPGGLTGQIQYNAAGAFGGISLPTSGILKGASGPAFSTATPGTDYENPLTFGSGLTRTVDAIAITTGGVTNAMLAGSIATNKLATLSGNGSTLATTTGTLTANDCVKIDASGNFVAAGAACGSGGGSGTITSINNQAGPTITIAKADDTNVTMTITQASNIITLTQGWTGRLSAARQAANTAYVDVNQSWAGTQDFASATHLRVVNAAGYTPTLNGHIGYDTTANSYKGYSGASVKTFAFLDSNITGTAANVTGTVLATTGGTGLSSYVAGDLIVANTTTTLTRLPDTATGNALITGGAGVAPSYGKIGLTTHVTGTLPEANGGTNQSTYAQGDILFASAANTLSRLTKDTNATRYLSNTGTNNNPTWSQVNLANGVTGNLSMSNLASGVGASGSTFLRGDGAWATPAGTISGLTPTALVVGLTATTISTPNGQATMDGGGNISTPGNVSSGVGSANAGGVQLKQGTASSPAVNSILIQAPTSVTAYKMVLPGSSGTGIMSWTDVLGTMTGALVSTNGSGNILLSAGTIAIASGKTLTVSNSMTQTATDGSTVAFGAGGTVAYLGSTNAWTGSNTWTGVFNASGASRSAPAQTGTSLPATCTVGDQYFKSDASAGQNLYGCTATNTWTQQAGSGTVYYQTIQDNGTAKTQRPAVNYIAGANVTLTIADDGPTRTNVTIASSGGGGTGVGRQSLGATWTSIPDGACQAQTATWTGITTSDTVSLGAPSGLTSGLLPTGYVSAADTVTIRVCNLSGGPLTPGSLTFNGTLAVYNLSGSSSINFSLISDGACAANTFSLTGVAAGDPVVPKWPSTLEAGLLGSMVATATDTVQVRLCNLSGADVDPASQSFGASIAK